MLPKTLPPEHTPPRDHTARPRLPVRRTIQCDASRLTIRVSRHSLVLFRTCSPSAQRASQKKQVCQKSRRDECDGTTGRLSMLTEHRVQKSLKSDHMEPRTTSPEAPERRPSRSRQPFFSLRGFAFHLTFLIYLDSTKIPLFASATTLLSPWDELNKSTTKYRCF